jgi:Beta/Gamma crystallin/Peptidase inhibitor family I36
MTRQRQRYVSVGLVAGAVLVLGGWQRRAVPRPLAPRSGITVFEDINYGGRSRTFTVDVPDLRKTGLNDRISSLAVAPGETWQICVDPNYRGRCTLVTDLDPNLVDSGWNDRISSLRRVRTDADRGPFPRGEGRGEGPQTLELFAGTDYTGQRKVISGPVADFRSIGFNDRALSVRVRGGGVWEICVNANFDDCRAVNDDVSDLNALGVGRLVSSARPRLFGPRGGAFPPPPARVRIILFSGVDFTGRSMTIDEALPSLGAFNGLARSLRVVGGRWDVCESIRYGGRCATVTGDVRDLRSLRLEGRIQSVRPREDRRGGATDHMPGSSADGP